MRGDDAHELVEARGLEVGDAQPAVGRVELGEAASATSASVRGPLLGGLVLRRPAHPAGYPDTGSSRPRSASWLRSSLRPAGGHAHSPSHACGWFVAPARRPYSRRPASARLVGHAHGEAEGLARRAEIGLGPCRRCRRPCRGPACRAGTAGRPSWSRPCRNRSASSRSGPGRVHGQQPRASLP